MKTSTLLLAAALAVTSACSSANGSSRVPPADSGASEEQPAPEHQIDPPAQTGQIAAPPTCTDADGDGAFATAGCGPADCDDSDHELGAIFETDCGRCVAICEGEAIGADTLRPFDGGDEDASAVEVDEDGALSPSRPALVSNRFAWVTEPAASVVVKLDQATGMELARYRTGPGGDDPRWVAVAPDGRALVVNRLSKTALVIEPGDCRDRDGDGVVETSNERDDLLAWGEDECAVGPIALADVPSGAAIAMSSATSTKPFGWIAAGAKLFEIDLDSLTQTGRQFTLPSGTAPTPSTFEAISAGPAGTLFALTRNQLFEIDLGSLEATSYALPSGRDALDLAVARDGRVWLTGSSGVSILRADGVFEVVAGACGSAITVDGRGVAFVAEAGICGARGIARIDPETLEVSRGQTAADAIVSVGVDLDGWVRAVSPGGAVFRVHPDVLVSDPEWLEHTATGVNGDFTGAELANVLSEAGRYSAILEGCAADERTDWSTLRWFADVPRGTSLTFELRAADSHALLGGAAVTRVAAPSEAAEGDEQSVNLAEAMAAAGGSQGAFLQVTTVLEATAHQAAPRLFSFEAYHACSAR